MVFYVVDNALDATACVANPMDVAAAGVQRA
jgi:hypothetical protein